MNIVDILIIIFILIGGFLGLKRGAVKEFISAIGFFVIVVLSFLLKNPLSVIFYENLPFFRFGGIIKGVEVLNILLYELLAFVIIFLALTLILRILIVISGLLEKILKMTIFLSIPSKILGIFVGAFEWYIYTFLILVVVSVPVFNLKSYLDDSKLATFMLEDTPILSPLAKTTVDTYTEVYTTIKDSKNEESIEVNDKIVRILIKNEIVTRESIEKLVNRGKIFLSESYLEELNISK